MRRIIWILILVGCGDNEPLPDASPLPSCEGWECQEPVCDETYCVCQMPTDEPVCLR